MQERRKASRFKVEQAIQISFGRESYIRVKGIDISRGGLLCASRDDIELYSRIFLLLSVPVKGSYKEVKCEGIVTRIEPLEIGFEIGVEFSEVDPMDKEFFDVYLKSLEG